jgi:hypothetical protein
VYAAVCYAAKTSQRKRSTPPFKVTVVPVLYQCIVSTLDHTEGTLLTRFVDVKIPDKNRERYWCEIYVPVFCFTGIVYTVSVVRLRALTLVDHQFVTTVSRFGFPPEAVAKGRSFVYTQLRL